MARKGEKNIEEKKIEVTENKDSNIATCEKELDYIEQEFVYPTNPLVLTIRGGITETLSSKGYYILKATAHYKDGSEEVIKETSIVYDHVLLDLADKYKFQVDDIILISEKDKVYMAITVYDGVKYSEIGESNDRNLKTDIAKENPHVMAFKRARGRLLIRVMGLKSQVSCESEFEIVQNTVISTNKTEKTDKTDKKAKPEKVTKEDKPKTDNKAGKGKEEVVEETKVDNNDDGIPKLTGSEYLELVSKFTGDKKHLKASELISKYEITELNKEVAESIPLCVGKLKNEGIYLKEYKENHKEMFDKFIELNSNPTNLLIKNIKNGADILADK